MSTDSQFLPGDSTRHLPQAELERSLATLSPETDRGRVAMLVARTGHGRGTPDCVELNREEGMPGDRWFHGPRKRPETQLTLMRADVARLFANGQALSLFGDNLLVELDLSLANLPAGSRLRVGMAQLEVTPEPHTGCAKFRQRFGEDAFRLTADPRFVPLRLRGIYARVVTGGTVSVGDRVEVLSRG